MDSMHRSFSFPLLPLHREYKPDAEVLIRLGGEALENNRGFVFEILGHEYGYSHMAVRIRLP